MNKDHDINFKSTNSNHSITKDKDKDQVNNDINDKNNGCNGNNHYKTGHLFKSNEWRDYES